MIFVYLTFIRWLSSK